MIVIIIVMVIVRRGYGELKILEHVSSETYLCTRNGHPVEPPGEPPAQCPLSAFSQVGPKA